MIFSNNMNRLPTDLRILSEIYIRYYETFAAYKKGDESRSAKVYVPIDIQRIADDLKVDSDIIFGRLYYHLDQKYGYKRDDGTLISFFSLRSGDDVNCINFPLMASVLADLSSENRKYRTAITVAVISLIISIIAIMS